MKIENEYYENRKWKQEKIKFWITQERLEYIIFELLYYDKKCKYDFLELWSWIWNSIFYLANKYPNINFYWVEINKNEVELWKQKIKKNNIKNIFIFQWDATNYTFDKQFDFVYSEQVIEHLENQEWLIKNMIDNLKKWGSFFISAPNYNFPIEQHIKVPFITWFSKKTAIKLMIFLLMKKKSDYYKYIFPITTKNIFTFLEKENFNWNIEFISKKIPSNKYSKNKTISFILSFTQKIIPDYFYKIFFPWLGIIWNKK